MGSLTQIYIEKNLINITKIKEIENIGFKINYEPNANIELAIVGVKDYIDEKWINKFQNLKEIFTLTTGLTHISKNIINKKVKLVSLLNYKNYINNIPSTAEHAILLILMLARNANLWIGKNYIKREDYFIGTEISNKNIGIIGGGRLGSMIASRLEKFNCKIYYNDIDNHCQMSVNSNYVFMNKSKLLEISDVIIISASYNIINPVLVLEKSDFIKIKNKPFLINIARDELLERNALVNSIEKFKISGFATDHVREEYSSSQNDFFYSKLHKRGFNIIISPHIGGFTHDAKNIITDILITHLKGQK